jgi:hypothetical protein
MGWIEINGEKLHTSMLPDLNPPEYDVEWCVKDKNTGEWVCHKQHAVKSDGNYIITTNLSSK